MKPTRAKCSSNAPVAEFQGCRGCLTPWSARVSIRSLRRCKISSATAPVSNWMNFSGFDVRALGGAAGSEARTRAVMPTALREAADAIDRALGQGDEPRCCQRCQTVR